MRVYDMIIIGGGPGGYTAALYAARAGLDALVLEKLSAGGQMALTPQIDNYPGLPDGIDGYALGEQMQETAHRFGAQTEYAEVFQLEMQKDPKVVHTSEGTFYARTLVLATGAGPRALNVPGESEHIGQGLHYCAHCDGMFYRGKTVAVVGGGNSAVAEALTLARFCRKVILIHRRDSLRADKIYHNQLEKTENLEFRWNSKVSRLVYQDKLEGVVLTDSLTGEESLLPCDGIFVSIGRKPASELAAGQLDLDPQGYILADESTKTSIGGVYAVGDVRTKALRQIVTAVADGAMAVHSAQEYLSETA